MNLVCNQQSTFDTWGSLIIYGERTNAKPPHILWSCTWYLQCGSHACFIRLERSNNRSLRPAWALEIVKWTERGEEEKYYVCAQCGTQAGVRQAFQDNIKWYRTWNFLDSNESGAVLWLDQIISDEVLCHNVCLCEVSPSVPFVLVVDWLKRSTFVGFKFERRKARLVNFNAQVKCKVENYQYTVF